MKSFFSIIFLVYVLCVSAQVPGTTATAVLNSVSQKLNSLFSVSYSYIREMRYYADNYDSKDTASMYIEFSPALPMGVRFQAARNGDLYIYDGKRILDIDANMMTIDSSTASSERMLSNSFLYNSMASLRNNLPMIIKSDSFSKVLSDTVLNGRQLLSIRMEAAGTYLGAVTGTGRMDDPSLRRPYFLLVDKKTLLPYQFVSKLVNGADDRDYIRVTYSDVKPNPPAKAGRSWTYAAYEGKYKPYVEPVKVPLVKAGDLLPSFRLPVYTEKGSDSLSSELLRGKLVLVEFWFKSCGPCIKAMPHYNALQEKYKSQGFELVTINLDDPVEDVAYFYKKYPPAYRMLYNGISLFESLGFEGCPSSVLVDRTGKVVKTFYGFNGDEIGKSIEGLF